MLALIQHCPAPKKHGRMHAVVPRACRRAVTIAAAVISKRRLAERRVTLRHVTLFSGIQGPQARRAVRCRSRLRSAKLVFVAHRLIEWVFPESFEVGVDEKAARYT